MLRSLLTNPWIWLATFFIAGSLLALGALLVVMPSPAALPSGQATAILTVIPAPSPTLPEVTASPLLSASPTPDATPTLVPGTLAVGAYIQIAGTGGDGLRLRTSPSLDTEIRFLGLEAEVFQISDGPRQSDGYTWWHLVAPYDESRRGWAVSSYMVVIQNP